MSYIPNAIAPQSGIKTFEENVEYLTSPTSGGGGMLGDTADMGAGSSTSSQQTLNAPTDGAATRLPDQWTQPSNELSASLLSPVERGLTLTSEELQRLGSSFQEQAGPQRTWDAAGGQEAVSGLLRPETTQKYVQPTKELLQSSYKGPSGLPEADVAALKTQQQTLADTTKALQTPSGAMGMLEVQTPGITRGEAKYDVQALWGSPEYHSAVGRLQRQVGALGQKIEGEATGAADYAKQRIVGEQRIAENARSSLGSGRNVINQQLEDEIAKIAGVDKASQSLEQFKQTRDISALPTEIQGQITETPKWQDYQKRESDWEKWFSPGSPYYQWQFAYPSKESYVKTPEIDPFLKLEPGSDPTRQNMATDEQRQVYNTIQELLGEAERLEKAGDPYKASQIRFDVENFMKAG